ncbi:proton-coupled zinc antiporter SLC30A8 [Hemicordylus capensis]|uniref:proton-coupled zinc antiporter SLC30A8 n=1 Tax=Hemicordylus capensis TaxID=884348 RepID=UPI002303847F|nr:proton-coupled zinc antiporter SLC30A8 [Hemicordylus capensis]
MMTTKDLETTCLVDDRDTKRYSSSPSSIDLPENHSDKENHHEKQEASGSRSLHHCHNHSKACESRNTEHQQAKCKLYLASIFCLIFMTAEIIGGQIAGSLAVIMDAVHAFVDLMSFLIIIFSLQLSSKPPSMRLTYGWHRAEILGALLSIVIVWATTGVLMYLAMMRLLHSHYEIEATVMLFTSASAVIVNIILSLMLHQTGHGNIHNAQQTSNHRSGLEPRSASDSVSVRAAFVRVVGDLLQSISVLISALIIFFKPEYKVADPICTFIFSIFILGITVTILWDILLVLMEGTPKGFIYNAVRERILAVDKVESVHNLHLWSLTMSKTLLTAHIVTVDAADKQQILKDVTAVLFDTYNFYTITLQIEPEADQKPECIFCQDPKD